MPIQVVSLGFVLGQTDHCATVATWQSAANYPLYAAKQAFAMLFNGLEIPPKIALFRGGDPTPHLIHGSLGPLHMLNAISIEPAVIPPLTLHVSYTSLWDGLFHTPKLPLPL